MTITNGYTTLALVAAELGTSTAANYDARIEQAIEAASRQIDDYCGRRFWQDSTVVTREFYCDHPTELVSQAGAVMDISTTTGLIVKLDTGDNGGFATTVTISTEFVLTPPNAADEGLPYTGIRLVDGDAFPMSERRPGCQVTAKFGFATVPEPVAQACLIQSVLLFKATDAAMGGLSFGDGAFMRVRGGLNPIALSLVDRYAFPAVA
jgi:hypothetical protein